MVTVDIKVKGRGWGRVMQLQCRTDCSKFLDSHYH